MTFKERMSLMFHRDECIRIMVFDETKRLNQKIVRVPKGSKTIEYGGNSYIIDVEDIYYLGGIPTIQYHITNANAITPVKPKDFKDVTDSAKQMNNIFKQQIISDITKGATEEKMTLKNMLMLLGVVVIGVLGVGLFIVYNQVQAVNDYIEQNKDVIELIKDYLLRNGG